MPHASSESLPNTAMMLLTLFQADDDEVGSAIRIRPVHRLATARSGPLSSSSVARRRRASASGAPAMASARPSVATSVRRRSASGDSASARLR